MDARASAETIDIPHPFRLLAADGQQPAGRHVVHREEETLDGLSFEAWRCTSLTISRDGGGLRQALPITPAELALLRAADGRGVS
jgi:hypothetical protein